jgi:hypothetical protein
LLLLQMSSEGASAVDWMPGNKCVKHFRLWLRRGWGPISSHGVHAALPTNAA